MASHMQRGQFSFFAHILYLSLFRPLAVAIRPNPRAALQEAEDHCSSSPCVEGNCLNTPGTFYCHCPPDRAGRHCELLAQPCKSAACLSTFFHSIIARGVLIVHTHRTYPKFICFVCLIAGCISPNATIQCSGQGKCESKENGQSCVCYYGFTGPYCEHSK